LKILTVKAASLHYCVGNMMLKTFNTIILSTRTLNLCCNKDNILIVCVIPCVLLAFWWSGFKLHPRGPVIDFRFPSTTTPCSSDALYQLMNNMAIMAMLFFLMNSSGSVNKYVW